MFLIKYIFFAMVTVIAGCSSSNIQYNDLTEFLKDVDSQPVEEIAPLKEYLQPKIIEYNFSDKRSPFENPINYKLHKNGQKNKVLPDFSRKKTKLEEFELELFAMVGYINSVDNNWGLVTINNSVYKVEVGDYLGKNYGKVSEITADAIYLKEIIPSGSSWISRNKTIKLKK